MNTKPHTKFEASAPANVKAEVNLLKSLIRKYFAKQGKDIRSVRTNYSNYFASSNKETFANGGKPVAYLYFENSTDTDGNEIQHSEIEKAIKFVKSVLNEDCLELEYVESSKTLKVMTDVLYDPAKALKRPSAIAVSPHPKSVI